MLATATTWGSDRMAEINGKVQSSIVDARKIWLPLGTVVLAASVLIGVGMWIQKTNDKAVATDSHAAQLAAIKGQLDTLQGSLNMLTGMQQTVSDTRSEINTIKDDLKEMEREHRLFQDFVEGRIGSMPYRPSTEGGSR